MYEGCCLRHYLARPRAPVVRGHSNPSPTDPPAQNTSGPVSGGELRRTTRCTLRIAGWLVPCCSSCTMASSVVASPSMPLLVWCPLGPAVRHPAWSALTRLIAPGGLCSGPGRSGRHTGGRTGVCTSILTISCFMIVPLISLSPFSPFLYFFFFLGSGSART